MTYPPPHIPLWINSVRKEVIHSLIQLPPEGEKITTHYCSPGSHSINSKGDQSMTDMQGNL